IAVGDHYMDEILVIGDALLEAVAAESQTARDPRVVLTVSAVALIFDPYVRDEQRDFRDDLLLKDADGQIFVNYLTAGLFDLLTEDPEHHEERFLDLLWRHRDSITTRLRSNAREPAVWRKYLW